MSIKIDLGNQVRQTVLPQWKPLLPLFEAVMNSFQAIKDARLPKTIPGRITIEIERQNDLFKDDKLVFPMHSTNADIPYNEQNLWMIDERLTYHSFIASDKQLRTLEMLKTKSALRGDIVIFDEKILFADTNPELHPINSITTIEFKRPGRDDYTDTDNPLAQSFKLIEEIRAQQFQIKGRPVAVANDHIPASIYCICDLTATFRRVLKVQDAFVTPDNQGYYGFHRGFNAYYEVIDYTKMLRDAKNRNRIFFEKLNLVDNH
jgi:hypothetical protein